MCPFSVTLQHVPDRELGPLLIRLAEAGFRNPVIEPVAADGGPEGATVPALGPRADLAVDWQLVRERDGESYQWPEERDWYSRYRVFIGTTRVEAATPAESPQAPRVPVVVSTRKKPETRRKRIAWGCSSLTDGKRRPCCWAGCPHRGKHTEAEQLTSAAESS